MQLAYLLCLLPLIVSGDQSETSQGWSTFYGFYGCYSHPPSQKLSDCSYPAVCSAVCTQDEGCLAAEYRYPTSECWLYTSLGSQDSSVLCKLFIKSTRQLNVVGKPTKSDSVFHGGGASDRVVDGNDAVVWESNSCMHTQDPPNIERWFLVDLQAIYKIFMVKIYDRHSQRGAFGQISVAVTTNSAVWTTYNFGSFQLCYYLNVPPPTSQHTVDFQCANPLPSGRYVTARKDAINVGGFNYLVMCEMHVFIAL